MSSVTRFSGITEVSSIVASGVASCQISLGRISDISVAANMPVGLVAVPTDNSPPVPVEREALALAEGEIDAEGDSEAEGERLALGDCERLAEALGDVDPEGETLALGEDEAELEGDLDKLGLVDGLADGLVLNEGDADKLRDGLVEALGLVDALAETLSEAEGLILADGLSLTETEADGLAEELGEMEALGLVDAEAGLKAVITLANNRTITAPLTLNKVPVPTAPVPVLPLKVTSFSSVKPQSVSTTGAPFAAILLAADILFPFLFKQLPTYHRKSYTPSINTSSMF